MFQTKHGGETNTGSRSSSCLLVQHKRRHPRGHDGPSRRAGNISSALRHDSGDGSDRRMSGAGIRCEFDDLPSAEILQGTDESAVSFSI